MFDDGDEVTHKEQDVSAVIEAIGISQAHIGQHVLANFNEGEKYFIGYVTAKATGEDSVTVTFDDNDEASYQSAQLTEFPDTYSAQNGKEGIFNNYSPKWS